MRCSDAGIEFIKLREGFRSKPYNDVGGKPTVGYGHLIRPGESFGTLSESQATALLCTDLFDAEACIWDCVMVDITQQAFDALCSFIYNVGCTRFRGSTMLRYINGAMFDLAANEFGRWNKVGTQPVDGLTHRRELERELFLS